MLTANFWAHAPNQGPVTFAGCDNGACTRADCLRKLAVWEVREDFSSEQDVHACPSYLPGDSEERA